MRFDQDWAVPLLIIAVATLTGLITFMVFDPHPAACHHAVSHMHVPLRSFTWVCSHP